MKKLAWAAFALLAVTSCTTTEQRVGGAGVGAVAGAAVAGPGGAVVGGVAGAVTGPRVSRQMGVPQRRARRAKRVKRVRRA
jgi:osmotically inducible lipoprotein OsmB